jgi:hypothetical protein
MTARVRRGFLGGISYGWGLGIVNAGAVLLGLRLGVTPALVAGHLTAFSIGLFLVGISDVLQVRLLRLGAPSLLGVAGLGLLLAPSVVASLAAALTIGAMGSVVLAQSQRLVTADQPDNRWLMWSNVGAALAVAASSGLVAVLDRPLLVALPGLLAGLAATTPDLPGDDTTPAARPVPSRPATPALAPGATRARRPDDHATRERPVDPRLLLLIVLAVGTELTLANRVPDHLLRSGLDDVAALAPALIYVGVATARAFLAVRRPPPLPAVAVSACIVALAVAALLLGGGATLGTIAVLVGGMGAGALFPLTAASALAATTDPSRTSARITAMVGLGTGVTPLAVGFADGITGGAFWLVLPLAATVVLLVRRVSSS